MKTFRLSEHFTLAEFEKSATAIANGIDNRVPSQYVPALEQLCKTILEPLRAFANSPEGKQSLSLSPSQEVPIIISSGYRCPKLNSAVGGVYSSQHTLGEACDIRLPVSKHTTQRDGKAHTDKEILNSWFEWIVTNTDFDQAIIETANGKDFWIHVSCRANKRKNRHQAIRFLQKK